MGWGTIAKNTGSSGLRFGKMFKFTFYFLFILFILLNSLVESIQARSITPFISGVGEKMLQPMLSLRDSSNLIIETGGVYNSSDGFFRGLWHAILTYGDIFSSLFALVMWMMVLMWILAYLPISGDASRKFTNFTLSVFIMYCLQVGYLSIVYWGSGMHASEIFMIPFDALISFIKVIPFLIKKIPFLGGA